MEVMSPLAASAVQYRNVPVPSGVRVSILSPYSLLYVFPKILTALTAKWWMIISVNSPVPCLLRRERNTYPSELQEAKGSIDGVRNGSHFLARMQVSRAQM